MTSRDRPTRTVAEYTRLLELLTDLEVAELVLSDLHGYRPTSLRRAEDYDTITRLISAVREGAYRYGDR